MKNRKWLYQFFLVINSIVFIFVNMDNSIIYLDTLTILWSWTIWIHIIANMMQLATNFANESKINMCNIINYLMQGSFVILYIFCYCISSFFDESKVLLSFLLSFNLLIIFSFNKKRTRNSNKFLTIEKSYSTSQIKEYIKGKILNKNESYNYDENILIVITNVLSIGFILIIPVIGDIAYNMVNEISFLNILTLLIVFVFIYMSYIKYKKMGLSIFLFVIETLFSIAGMGIYITLSTSLVQGIPLILLMSYLCFPYIIRSYKISLVYHIENKENDR